MVLALAGVALGQTSLVRSALDGTVSDFSGGRIPQAAVTVRDVATHLSREVSSDAQGTFRIAELPPGTYEVSVAASGFTPYHHAGVDLPLGSTVHLDVALQPVGVNTQITVAAQPPAIDPTQTSLTSAVDTERIEELPVESRNYLNFALLAPGVSPSSQQAGRPALSPLADSGFSFGGLRGRSNSISIDGLENNDEYAGSSRTELSLETVQEFQVVNAGLSAESGGASGGSIDVITRTGANAIHGDAVVFLGNGSLDARDPFQAEAVQPTLQRYRTGAAVGGPIVKDRTFYYAAFEQEFNRGLDDSFLSQPLVNAVNRILAGGYLPSVTARQVSDGLFPTSRAETEASAKVDHQLTPRNSIMLRYAFTNNRESGDAFDTAGWYDASSRGSAFTDDNELAGSVTTVFDSQSVGDFRFQVANRQAVLRTNDGAGAGLEISGLIDFGRPYYGNGSRGEGHDQLTDTYSHAAGRHLWKAGVAYHRVREDVAMADGFGGLYIFGNLADFAAGQPDEFRQAFGHVGVDYAVQNYGGFVQDHWTAAANVTVDLGVRYDFEHLPGEFREDMDNVSPRIGIAWHAAPGWVLRGGYGIFFDRYVLASLNPALQLNGVNGFEQVVNGNFAPGPPSIYRTDPGLATPYSEQSSFAVERVLARDLTVTANYLFVRGLKLSRTRNVNFGPVRDPLFTDIFQLEDSASSVYNGASITVNRRMSDEFEFSASYTLSKTYDNASDFAEQPQNPLNLAPEWALSRQQQQQRFVANALWELPVGDEDKGQPAPDTWVNRIFGHIELAPIFTVESGHPADPLTGIDTYGTHAYPLSARPLGFGRNSLRTPALVNMDFRFLKYFPLAFSKTAHLDVVAEAFNLFNHANVVQIDPVFGSPGFLQPVADAGARKIQFSLDLEF
ncbi:MAG: TonB-dependent receptor [Bryobacteraceae bacterium]